MKKDFYSNGKVLLTGEYLVLDGAKGLALPTKFGQHLSVSAGEENGIRWIAYDHDGTVWLDTHFTIDEIKSETSSEKQDVREKLREILHVASKMHTGSFTSDSHLKIETRLTFPKDWGLGSSSTLICNIAKWMEIDPYGLQEKTFGGSGYDIACGLHDEPIIYRLEYRNPMVSETTFAPSFTDHLYFVYLNKKQNTRSAIENYRSHPLSDLPEYIARIDDITNAILDCHDVDQFASLIESHERIMSEILRLPTLKENLFPDFNGSIKSLGGWGGDFALAVSEEDPAPYFSSKGYGTIIRFSDMVK